MPSGNPIAGPKGCWIGEGDLHLWSGSWESSYPHPTAYILKLPMGPCHRLHAVWVRVRFSLRAVGSSGTHCGEGMHGLIQAWAFDGGVPEGDARYLLP